MTGEYSMNNDRLRKVTGSSTKRSFNIRCRRSSPIDPQLRHRFQDVELIIAVISLQNEKTTSLVTNYGQRRSEVCLSRNRSDSVAVKKPFDLSCSA